MGQVGKIVDVEGLEIYCSFVKEADNILSLYNAEDSEPWSNSGFVGDKSQHILEPVNVSLSLLVCKFYGSFIILLLKIHSFSNFIVVSVHALWVLYV